MNQLLSVGMLILVAGACSYFVSWDDSVKGGVGRSIVDLQQTWGEADAVRELSDGNKEYKYWLKKLDPSCVHYWIVDPHGIISGYHYEGRCRPIG